jgi:cytochrome bd ubiquinol oxidase subunit I
MVGCGLLMLALAWLGSYLMVRQRLERNRLLLRAIFFSFPLPFIAILTGWYTAEVGRQPWVVYGALRTADALTPFLTARGVTTSLIVFGVVYFLIFAFGTFYIYRLLRGGPDGVVIAPVLPATAGRPMALADQPAGGSQLSAGVRQ